jgi:hypothetical protein
MHARALIAAIPFLCAVRAGAAEIALPSQALERDRAVTAVYRLNGQATGKGTLAVRWTDALGRIVEERTIPVELVDETEIRFPLDLTRAVAMPTNSGRTCRSRASTRRVHPTAARRMPRFPLLRARRTAAGPIT